MTIPGIDADGHVLDNRDLIFRHLPESVKKSEWWFTPRNTWDTTLEGKFGQGVFEPMVCGFGCYSWVVDDDRGVMVWLSVSCCGWWSTSDRSES